MTDDNKNKGRSGDRTGNRKPYAGREGERPQGARGKPFVKREGAGTGEDRPKPRFDGDRKPFSKREDGERKPFQKRDGDRKPYAPRDGEKKPFVRREGDDRKPFAKREDGERKPFQNRDGDRKPYAPRDGEKKPFVRREGDDRKPFAKREDGERKPFQKRDGDRKPYAARDGDKRPFVKRDGDRKPFQMRDDDRRPQAENVAEAARGEERIAKRLARAGVASRRDAEDMIAAGRVSVNGKVLESPALNVTGKDRIEIDGAPIPVIERTRLFLFHKPSGVVTTNKDPEGRQTVFDVLPKGLPRLLTVGRLDINTEGLLLLTNDGGLARTLELPSTGWLRRYRVRVHGKVEPEKLEALKDGIAVDGVFYGSIEAVLEREQGTNAWISIGLREGKNREVKNVMGALGLEVTRLIRVSYGPFQLGELAEGEIQELRGRHLRDQLGDKLIAESGADFDAPVIKEFSNQPVAQRVSEEEVRKAAPRKRDKDERREDALGRLQTSRPGGRGGPKGAGFKSAGAKGADARGGKGGFEKKAEPQRSRTANVWMAPGAKALGPKKAARRAEETEGKRYAGKPRPQGADGPKGPRRDDRGGRPDGNKPAGGRPVGNRRDRER
ncbi:pseudouridine synthase [Aliihoeflea sp. 40Bstr573]|uniref:pseudouridine synthase n=1 Tax=Aliihoeflea sp. 40Bstr573 TaxID=2696467 RepID=UPI00209656F7|nr:pseudouridine synthase [Aliihoeflea sp. 40Bstr573]MCO6386178.1 pseudouridine synthase [Aliihoeflea sp. 40Bstr573]